MRDENRRRVRTPWGASQSATVLAKGVTFHSTSGHGGIHLAAPLNRRVHEALRRRGGWYEDCAYHIAIMSLPELFAPEKIEEAKRGVKEWFPDAYTAATGEAVSSDESHVIRERAQRAEAGDRRFTPRRRRTALAVTVDY